MQVLRRAATLVLVTLAAAALAAANASAVTVSKVVDVSRDTTAQNETPLAIDPLDPKTMITGSNDWNDNDGCGVYSTSNGGKTWTSALPNGFLPGVTRYTNDPSVPGTGAYDVGGDPAIAFGPDGTAYYVCMGFNLTPPYQETLLLNRSSDGGRTWQQTGLTQVSTWTGNGKGKGSTGQFADHESISVDTSPTSPYRGRIYVTWAQFNGYGTHSPVNVAVSSDGGRSFSLPVQVTSGTVRNDQDQRIAIAPNGDAYLTFDNGAQGGKGTSIYASKSTDGGASWSTPVAIASYANPVCVYPPYCFNIAGGQFRAGGSYVAPAFDASRNRLDVVFPDIRGPFAQVYFMSLRPDLSVDRAPAAIAPGFGDRFESEIGVAPNGRVDVSFYDRSYSSNALVDLTYATSPDGGASWTTARVTPAGFDPSTWGVPSGDGYRPFIGDYNAIVSTDAFAGLVWTGFAPPQPYNLEVDYATVTP